MPSGSHSGSGGSHSSGGSSFGGGSRFSGGGSHNHDYNDRYRYGRGTTYVSFFGRSYVLTGRKSKIATFFSLSFIMLFLVVIGIVIGLSANTTIKKIKSDYQYYQAMIAYAENNPGYIITGKITDKFLNESCDKWYITYSFETENGYDVDGYTYSVYTFDETRQFVINQPIQLAVNSSFVTENTDSIPLDYKDMPLERDGEYVVAKNTKIVGFIMAGICGAVGCLFIVLAIVNKKKLANEPETESSTTAGNYDEDYSTKKQATKKVNCRYCGSTVDENNDRCPCCGAKITK